MRADDPNKMAIMRDWLAAVSAELGVDPGLIGEVEHPLLDLIAKVAHGQSRPGAPLTAFLIGMAAGRGGDILELTARIATLADSDGATT